jgi:peptidoglycan/xylan/chitin deacetylase (PgdA/CDA1 family)
MRKLAVLMYHAVADQPDSAADAHYAVSELGFRTQLGLMRDAAMKLCSVRDLVKDGIPRGDRNCVAITFDDGHASNLKAATELAAQGGKADLFVNPSTVGREHYLTWPELRDLAGRGMSIQSHGYSHRYLDDLPLTDVQYELAASKAEIEDRLGSEVVLFAPPGGRMPRGFHALASSAGYEGVCSSRPGMWKYGAGTEITRFAITQRTTDAQLAGWIVGASAPILKLSARYHALRLMKRVLGNHSYERVRGVLLG